MIPDMIRSIIARGAVVGDREEGRVLRLHGSRCGQTVAELRICDWVCHI